MQRELDAYAAYYRAHPNAARLWLDGRVSPTVRAEVLLYHRAAAQRLTTWQSRPGWPRRRSADIPHGVELGDRTLELAFRGRREPDPQVLQQGRVALTAYLQAALRDDTDGGRS